MKAFVRDTWVEVDLDAIAANMQAIRRHIPPQAKIMAVVKADGYGHGSVQVAQEALANGADYLAVAMLDEAVVLRRAGIEAPILVLGFTPVEAIPEACKWKVELTAYQLDWMQAASQLTEAIQTTDEHPLRIHIKLDTGMGRLGVRDEAELLAIVQLLTASSGMHWSGIYTHFACADEADTTHAQAQHNLFKQHLAVLQANGYILPHVHCNNTAGAIAFPHWSYDLIRFGIGLYGLYPSPYLKDQRILTLTPALSLKTRITHVKTFDQIATISYGATYTAQSGEQVATLPIGYADGFSRSLSNRGIALHNGECVPIIGRICMDQTMIRISHGDAKCGDEVVLYGRQGGAEISLDEVATLLGTINYEVSCMLNYRVPRVYVRDEQIVEVCHHIAGK